MTHVGANVRRHAHKYKIMAIIIILKYITGHVAHVVHNCVAVRGYTHDYVQCTVHILTTSKTRTDLQKHESILYVVVFWQAIN